MARKSVNVIVTLPTDPTGPIGARVDKWTVWTYAKHGDHVQWTLVQRGGRRSGKKLKVVEMRIVTEGGDWPFAGTNPGWQSKAVTTKPRKHVPDEPYTLSYSVEVRFTDDFAGVRTLTIDPDMVIDT